MTTDYRFELDADISYRFHDIIYCKNENIPIDMSRYQMFYVGRYVKHIRIDEKNIKTVLFFLSHYSLSRRRYFGMMCEIFKDPMLSNPHSDLLHINQTKAQIFIILRGMQEICIDISEMEKNIEQNDFVLSPNEWKKLETYCQSWTDYFFQIFKILSLKNSEIASFILQSNTYAIWEKTIVM